MSIPIVFGWGKGAKQLGEGFVHACGNCRNVRRFAVVETSRKVSLYFVPVAKWSREYFYVCPVCSSGFKIPNRELAQRILAGALGDPRSMPDDLAREIAQANGIPLAPMQGRGEKAVAGPSADDVPQLEADGASRLTEVLNEFLCLEWKPQQTLAGTAVDWALVSFAHSARRAVVESAFWAAVDFVYSQTSHAARLFSERERAVIMTEASKKFQEWTPLVGEIMRGCLAAVSDWEAGESRRAFEFLFLLESQLLQHGEACDIRELIRACAAFGCGVSAHSRGGAAIADCSNALGTVMAAAAKIASSVDGLIAAGMLVWKDGTIQKTVAAENVDAALTNGSSETIDHAETDPASGSIVWVACPGCDGEIGISDRHSEATVKCPKCSTEIPNPRKNVSG